ncbi:MAG: type II secretion system protein [Chlamydiota bacterium]
MNRKKMNLKKTFTLIELFIALSVLLLVAGVIGWNVKGAIDHHRFLGSVDRFAVQLRELQALALSYQSDMEVEFSRKGELISYMRKTDEPLTILDRGRVSLDGVTEVLFNGKKRDILKFNVLSTGRIEPPGVLRFQQKKESLWVDFSTPFLVKIRSTAPIQTTEAKL